MMVPFRRMANATRSLRACALPLFLAVLPVHADLKGSLALFFEMGPQDSVVALTQKSATALQVETVDMTTTEPKTLVEEVGEKPMARILEEARAAGVPVSLWTPEAAAPRVGAASAAGTSAFAGAAQGPDAGVGASPAAERTPGRNATIQRRNRILYMAWQVPVSTYIYGVSIPFALDVENPRVYWAMPLLIAPATFGAHLWFARTRTFEDAHFLGTRYLSIASTYAAYALPFAAMGDDFDAYRTAAFASLAAYPLGVWGGYALGDRYVGRPGRIETQSKFAAGLGTLGFFTPFLYYEHLDPNIESVIRLGLGQSVAFATAGHFISQYYRADEDIPGGVTTGILTHAALGAGIGLEIAALADASTVRPWLGAALAGGTLGFMEGLWYFKERYDNNERGFYNLLGTAAGALMGTGVLILTLDEDNSDYANKVLVSSLLVGGSLIGYIATDLLTSGMQDRPASAPRSWTDRLAFNPIPVPELQSRPRSGDKSGRSELYYRYRLPGISYSF